MAVTNAALANLYNCKPEQVTVQVLVTSVLFVGISIVVCTVFGEQFGVVKM